jgi:phage N-6-adenine-methyltransferase
MSDAKHRFNNDLRYRDNAHPNQRQLTPHYVLDPVRKDLGGTIELDPCTEADNPTGAEFYYTAADDGLARSWHADQWTPSIFVNPPYGRAKDAWVVKCIEAGQRGQVVALLIPSHTDTRIWHKAIETASSVCFIKGRVKFGVLRPNRRQEAASHPSCVIGWNTMLNHSATLGFASNLAAFTGEADK